MQYNCRGEEETEAERTRHAQSGMMPTMVVAPHKVLQKSKQSVFVRKIKALSCWQPGQLESLTLI